MDWSTVPLIELRPPATSEKVQRKLPNCREKQQVTQHDGENDGGLSPGSVPPVTSPDHPQLLGDKGRWRRRGRRAKCKTLERSVFLMEERRCREK